MEDGAVELARETDNHGEHQVRRFALATYQPVLEHEIGDDELIAQLAKALIWLLERQRPEGIWRGDNPQDTFESTSHACQTLLMLGVRPESTLLNAPLQWLIDLDADAVPYHFWRAGTLLNISHYDQPVADDLEYIWSYRRRVVGHRDYPAMVFLLKRSLFVYNGTLVPAPIGELVGRVVSQWDADECWFGRTSITTMAYALLLDQDFPDKETILRRSRSFLLNRFAERDSRASFDENLVDDCYTIYNLCEQPGLLDEDPELLSVVTQCAEGIRSTQGADSSFGAAYRHSMGTIRLADTFNPRRSPCGRWRLTRTESMRRSSPRCERECLRSRYQHYRVPDSYGAAGTEYPATHDS